MRLGLNLGYVTSAAQLHANLELAAVADQIGYDVVWVAEAYGSDAATVLGAMLVLVALVDAMSYATRRLLSR